MQSLSVLTSLGEMTFVYLSVPPTACLSVCIDCCPFVSTGVHKGDGTDGLLTRVKEWKLLHNFLVVEHGVLLMRVSHRQV